MNNTATNTTTYVLFGLISPELILSKMQAEACKCTLTIL